MWCAVENYNCMCHIRHVGVTYMCKKILDSNFNKVVVDKISISHEITPNLTYSHFKVNLKRDRQTACAL